MDSALFGIVRMWRRLEETLPTLSARFVTAITESARPLHAAATIGCASTGNARRRAHHREGARTEWQLPSCGRPVPFRKHIPMRRRIMEGMLMATSLVLLWLIILAIDERAGTQMLQVVQGSVSRNGVMATEVTNTATHVTRTAWELSFIYGPLMTFAAVAIVLVVVMKATTK
jgi:hypothetical protein